MEKNPTERQFDSRRAAGTFSIWTAKDEIRKTLSNDQHLTLPEIIVLLARNNKGTWEQFFKNEVFHVALGIGTLLELLERKHISFNTEQKILTVDEKPTTPLPEYLEKDLFYMSSFIAETPPLTIETWLLACVPFIKNVPTIPSGPKRFEMILDHLSELKIVDSKRTKGYTYDLLNPSSMQQLVQEIREMILSDTDKPKPSLCTLLTLTGQVHRGLGFGNKTLIENFFDKEMWASSRHQIGKYAEPKKWLPLVQNTDPLISARIEIFNSLRKILTPYGAQQHATLRQQSETKEAVRQSIQDKGAAPPSKAAIKRVMDVKVSTSGDSVAPLLAGSGDHFAAWLKEHLSLSEALCLFCRSEKTGDWRQVQDMEIFHLMLAALSLHELVCRNRLIFDQTKKLYSINTKIENPPTLPFYLDQDLRLATEVFGVDVDDFTLENWLELPQSKDEKRLENVVAALAKKEILDLKRGVPSQLHYAASVISTVEQKQLIDESAKSILACTRVQPPIKLSLLLTISNFIPKQKGVSKKIITRFVKEDIFQVYRSRLGDRKDGLFLSYSSPEDPQYPSARMICDHFGALTKYAK